MPVCHTAGQQHFPKLSALIGCYFHQNFDIHGDTLEAVVAVYVAECHASQRRLVVQDIDGFLATGDDGLDQRFQDYFRPDIIPTGFRPTTREFLLAIRERLIAASGGK